jgi:molybdopterin molybdotransferase
MTGAQMPAGADAVVPVEATDFSEREPGIPAPAKVQIYKSVHGGDYVRLKGEDVRIGETMIEAGRILRPQDIGLLAMLGIAQVPVYRIPRVAILSAGDELLPVSEELNPGKIYDSNSYTLISLVEKYGGQPLNLGIVPDNFEAVHTQLERAVAEGVDLILSSAGVSVGAFDFVRAVVEQFGNLVFWRVNMRPGKPIAFGYYRDIPFIGLPGNPVSAFVGFEVFVRPAIKKMNGEKSSAHRKQKVSLQEAVESDGRESYLRGVISYQNGRWLAHLAGHQSSGNLRSLVQANALLLVPSGVKFLPIGTEVEAWIIE